MKMASLKVSMVSNTLKPHTNAHTQPPAVEIFFEFGEGGGGNHANISQRASFPLGVRARFIRREARRKINDKKDWTSCENYTTYIDKKVGNRRKKPSPQSSPGSLHPRQNYRAKPFSGYAKI